jgi:hypothetical protein
MSYFPTNSAPIAQYKNYILNPKAIADTAGYATYKDAAQATPVDGTGGSPTLTFTRNTSSPLEGPASFLITTTAANLQGEGASNDFTIDLADRAKVLSISFDYATDVTIATGDFAVYIYDVTNALIIQPAGFQIQGGVSGTQYKQIATFQTSSNSSSYRLIIHRAVTTATAVQLKIDNVIVSPQVVQYGAPVTDWVSYTPTLTHASGGITNATASGKWRRVGDTMQASGRIVFSSTSAAFNGLFASIPSGYTIDTSKLSSTTSEGSILGSSHQLDFATQTYGPGQVTYNGLTSIRIDAANVSGSTVVGGLGNTTPFTYNVNDEITWEYFAPITGWSSTVQMSNDTDTRVVAASVSKTAAQTFNNTSVTQVQFDSVTSPGFDTHAAFNVSTYRYTVQVPGRYRHSGVISWVATTGAGDGDVRLYKNGAFVKLIPGAKNGTSSSTFNIPFTFLDTANAGDYYEIYAQQSSGGNLNIRTNGTAQDITSWNIERLSGPSAIAASETVAVRATNTAGTSLPDSTVVPWATVTFDTHGGMAASGTYTVQVSGKYLVCSTVGFNAYNLSTSQVAFLSIKKNGSEVSIGKKQYGNGVSVNWSIDVTDTIQCNAGDTITIVHNTNLTGTMSTAANTNHVSITRVGN